ncbi:MAG: hypothetical protein JXA24_02955 [Proteobacteria bacterium]|nr:hypothetical protein [Pseudomonadota bacterium]
MKYRAIFAAAVLVALAMPAMASANSVDVTGDIRRDGYLTINLDWDVDTRDYPGLKPAAMKEKVHDQMYNAMLPKLVAATQGVSVSFDKCQFTTMDHKKTLIKERKDGTKVFDLNYTVRFNAPYAESVASTPPPVADKGAMQKVNVRGNWQSDVW